MAAVRNEIHELDEGLAVTNIQTMEQRISDSVVSQRFMMWLMTVFAVLALLVAAIGIYGVLAYAVTRRTKEIGIRMALGAQKSDVLRLVIGQGLTLIAMGIGLGVIGSLALSRFIASLLFQVSPTDPSTFLFVSTLLLAIALAASYLPAARAVRIKPMVALRYE